MIIDSTRRGKRIPDALSKTIPIWCCTINRAILNYRRQQSSSPSENNWDDQFHSLPSAVFRSEHDQIESRIDGFVKKLQVYIYIHNFECFFHYFFSFFLKKRI